MAVSPTNWLRLKEIVADAIDAPAEEREAILVAACESDADLETEARKLVAAYDDSDGVVLNRGTDRWLGIGGPDVLSLGGQRIGRYRLIRVLGEGAMSAVYLARQVNPDRDVAVKLLRTALPLVDARQRFRREATALARLRHPNIAVIYEAGLHDANEGYAVPFIAMEFVDGVPLTDYAKRHNLDRAARINVMIVIARAVQHAHQQTIVHRDLKPANVLVDAGGVPKVLDFGIARIAAVDSDRTTWQTTAGLLLGTPGYMSPEQCSPDGENVDVRSDVWSLGVMLYELLVGRLPIEAKGGSISDVMRRLETQEPTPPHRVDPTVRGDLETILMTAVCRDKERRYASAQAFADDLGRYLKQLPIEAHPPTTFYLASKFARRHRGLLIAATAALVALLVSTLVSTRGFVKASRERDRAVDSESRARESERKALDSEHAAESSERRSNAVRDFLVEIIGSPDPVSGKVDVTVLDMLRQNERRLAARFADDPLTAAELFSTVGWTYFNLSDYEAAERNLRRAVELEELNLGKSSAITLGDQCRLVTILRWRDNPAAAKIICDEALAESIKAFGIDNENTFPLLDNDAGITDELGDLNGSIVKYERVYRSGLKNFGPEDDATLTAGNNLGLALLNIGRYADSQRTLSEVVEHVDKLRGPDSVRALTPRQNLATALLYLDRVPEAQEILVQALATARRNLPPGHRSTRAISLSLADTYRQLGKSDEAIALMRQVIAASTAVEGRSGSSTVHARIGLMSTLSECGRQSEAIATGRAILDDCVADNVSDDDPAWAARQTLATVLNEVDTANEAEAMGRLCLARHRRLEGDSSAATLISQCNYAATLGTLGRTDEAEREARRALSLVKSDQAVIEMSLHRLLARLHVDRGEFDAAQKELDYVWPYFASLGNRYYCRRAIDLYLELALKRGDVAALAHWRVARFMLVPRTPSKAS